MRSGAKPITSPTSTALTQRCAAASWSIVARTRTLASISAFVTALADQFLSRRRIGRKMELTRDFEEAVGDGRPRRSFSRVFEERECFCIQRVPVLPRAFLERFVDAVRHIADVE